MRPSGEARASVFKQLSFFFGLSLVIGFNLSYPNVVVVLLLFSSCSLMGDRSDCFFACFNFFQHSWRSNASVLFSDFYFQSYARSYLFDRRSYLTVPMHSIIRFAYQLFEARLSSYYLSIDLKFYICIIANQSYFFSFSFSNRSYLI